MKTRKAKLSELTQDYLMGYDVWGEDDEGSYLKECNDSLKYSAGTWYVLSNEEKLLSSLIVYNFEDGNSGIGSISTPPSLRQKGYASKLIEDTLDFISSDSPSKKIFLYSDIDAAYYEKFGFVKLPAALQLYKHTTCMIYVKNIVNQTWSELTPPKYF